MLVFEVWEGGTTPNNLSNLQAIDFYTLDGYKIEFWYTANVSFNHSKIF